MEAKQRIAKEVARKAAACTAIAMAREGMRACHHGPGESIPSAAQGPVVETSTGDTYSMPSHKGFGMSSEATKSPSHVTKMARECHATWQRGAKAVEPNKQFPTIQSVVDENPPLMYRMMLPHLRTKSADTPFTEVDSTCSTNSLPQALQVLSRCQ